MPTIAKRKRNNHRSQSKKRVKRAGAPNPYADKIATLKKQIKETPTRMMVSNVPVVPAPVSPVAASQIKFMPQVYEEPSISLNERVRALDQLAQGLTDQQQRGRGRTKKYKKRKTSKRNSNKKSRKH